MPSQSSNACRCHAGPAHEQSFGRYQQLPDGKPLPQGWTGSLAFANFFYSFKALQGGHIPPAVQDTIRTYTAERSRRITLAEVRTQRTQVLSGFMGWWPIRIQQHVLWELSIPNLVSEVISYAVDYMSPFMVGKQSETGGTELVLGYPCPVSMSISMT